MKKQLVLATAILFTGGTLLFTGCKKDDTTPPTVTMTGGDKVVSLQGSYTEDGATATDDEDGDLTVTTSGTVDVNNAGVYPITYTATDAAGNVGTATRYVTVKNDISDARAAIWVGTYSGYEVDAAGPWTYAQPVTVIVSTTLNNAVTINRLGDFANNNINMVVTDASGTIPNQTVSNVGTGSTTCDVHNRETISGTAVKTSTGFDLTYSDAKVSPCSGSRSNVTATFTKQ